MKKTTFLLLAFMLLGFSFAKAQDYMMGEIYAFAGNFAPKGWILCEGQLLNIQRNQALFSILGNTYGGDGRNTFALPDLRNREVAGASINIAPTTANPISLGQKRESNAIDKGTAVPQKLGLVYIICVEGYFPERKD